jgi:hypothetical protein
MQKIERCMFGLVRYSVSGRPREVQTIRGDSDRAFVYRRRMPPRDAYFFDRVVRQNEKDFESINMGREIRKAVKENAERLAGKMKERLGSVVPFSEIVGSMVPNPEEIVSRTLFDFQFPSECYFHKHSSSVVLPIGSNSFCVLAKAKEEISQLTEFIKSEFEKLSEVTKDFGLTLSDFLTGRKFQEIIIKSAGKVQNLDYKDTKNDFEKEVMEFCAQLTDSFLPNVEVSFTEPTETYECDVFLGFSENIKRIVEPTNYESVKDQMPKGENLKSQIILRTLDKAQRLGARSTVIVRGFPEDSFIDLKQIADSRGISLLSDSNYKDALPKLFFQDMLRAYSEQWESSARIIGIE